MTRPRSTEGIGDLFATLTPEKHNADASSLPTDQSHRDQAVDTTLSCIVEAPAGSGKTGLLIQRYLKLLAQQDLQQPEQVLAITFTLKAAGEIRDRIIEQLELASTALNDEHLAGFAKETLKHAKRVLERDRQMDWRLLENPRRLNLRTIDSICAEIARGLPLLSGGSGLSPVEDASSLHRLAAERTLLHLGGKNRRLSDAIGVILLHRDGDLQRCQSLLAEMLSLRDQWGRLIPLEQDSLTEQTLDEQVLPKLGAALAAAVRNELSEVATRFPLRPLEKLSALAEEMSLQPGYKGEPSPLRICQGRLSPPTASIEDLPIWRVLADLLITGQDNWRSGFNSNHLGFESTKAQKETLREIIAELRTDDRLLDSVCRIKLIPPSTYPAQQWRVAKALFVVLHHALIELQLVFAERGECDFTELGLLARAALQHENGALDTALGEKLQHLLVDEMQDTSTSQYELINLLIHGWDGHGQTVFLVGDPKQSIYLFRQARVERFIEVMNDLRIGDLSLNLLQLRSNFRSRPELVNSFNAAFERIFPRTPDGTNRNEVLYTSADPTRPPDDVSSAGIVWHPQIVPAAQEDDEPANATWFARAEAAGVREVIESWRRKPLPADKKRWSIAILVRNRSHLTHIVAELKSDSGTGPIPFRAIDIEPLSERREVLDLFALTRALMHPADRVAWLAILRAPWCGLELSDLHILCGQDDPDLEAFTVMELIQNRGKLLSDQGLKRLQGLASILQVARSRSGEIPLPELVEKTWKTLGADTYLNPEEQKNAEQYLSLLDELNHQGLLSQTDILQRELHGLYAAPSSAPDAIDMMTIHGAKGLEWDVVIVPGLEKRSANNSQRLLVWDEVGAGGEEGASVILAPIVGKGADDVALNTWLRNIHRRREEAECKRLFYVACTRAREELHLFATLTRRANGSLHSASGTLLAAAWPAAEQYFVDVNTQAKPLIAPVLSMPRHDESGYLPAMAAAGDNRPSFATLHRFHNARTFVKDESSKVTTPLGKVADRMLFARPEGSFEARAFGSTVHELIELLSRRIVEGATITELSVQIETWQPRIQALLRSHGVSPSALQQYTQSVQNALKITLADTDGQWILGTRKDALSEHALVQWEEGLSSVRIDRIFRAGASPHEDGDSYLWIIDFKTSSLHGSDPEIFSASEKGKYSSQLETYARIMRAADIQAPICLGLYYPLIPKLIWWPSETT